MNILGKITGVKYKVLLTEDLKEILLKDFDINQVPSACKDGLLKMILYCNLSKVVANGQQIKSEAVLCLTSSKLKGAISSSSNEKEMAHFFDENNFSVAQKELIATVLAEANQNKFILKVQFSK